MICHLICYLAQEHGAKEAHAKRSYPSWTLRCWPNTVYVAWTEPAAFEHVSTEVPAACTRLLQSCVRVECHTLRVYQHNLLHCFRMAQRKVHCNCASKRRAHNDAGPLYVSLPEVFKLAGDLLRPERYFGPLLVHADICEPCPAGLLF